MPGASKKDLRLYKLSEVMYSRAVLVFDNVSIGSDTKETIAALSDIESICQEVRKLLCSHPAFAAGRCAICNATHEELKKYNEQYAETSDDDRG